MTLYQNFLKIINPRPKVGALEISDIDLKFAQINNGQFTTFSVKLSSGVVQDGKIIDRAKFSEALKNLHRQITNNQKKEIYTIVNLPDNNIYSQTFILPSLEGSNFEETVELNLRMVTPFDYSTARVGWQIFKQNNQQGNQQTKAGEANKAEQTEILSFFIQAQIVDEIEDVLIQEKFVPVATESNALSIARLAVELGIDIDSQKNYILINFSNNGLSFNLISKNNLYFNHFISWAAVSAEEREIPQENFKKLIIEELKKVLSFYKTRWTEPIEKIFLVLPSKQPKQMEDNISKIISEIGLSASPLKLKKFSDISISWFSVLGSVIRGFVLWSEDNDINLSHSATKEKIFQYKLFHFINLWQKIIVSFLGGLLFVFISVDLFLNQAIEKKNSDFLKISINNPQNSEQDQTADRIKQINSQINFALQAQSQQTLITPFLEKIKSLSNANGVQIQRIFIQSFQSKESPIFINGFAPSSDVAIGFKNKLASDGSFNNINLPITKITPADKGINFIISFTLK